jgi:hypothetical protein
MSNCVVPVAEWPIVGALELPEGSAPRPVASPSHTGSNEVGTLLIAG